MCMMADLYDSEYARTRLGHYIQIGLEQTLSPAYLQSVSWARQITGLIGVGTGKIENLE